MSTGSKGWSAKLTRTMVLTDGTTLATLADVHTFVLNEPKHIQERNAWQRTAALLMSARPRCSWKRRRLHRRVQDGRRRGVGDLDPPRTEAAVIRHFQTKMPFGLVVPDVKPDTDQ